MIERGRNRVGGADWCVDDIDYAKVDRAVMRDETELFYIITSASFIEITSDLYTRNLIEFYHGDREIADWLANFWEHEEVQHGVALKRYVQAAWPDFDWQATYDAFFVEYAATCTVPDLEPARGLELAARCVVEMGTATLYGALHSYADEPVLKDLTYRIYADEVRHYKHFYRYFRRYQASERHTRWRVGHTLAKRLLATCDEDGSIAYRHVWSATRRGRALEDDARCESDYRRFRSSVTRLARHHAPRDVPVQMLIKPLDLPPPASRAAKACAGTLYRWWLG